VGSHRQGVSIRNRRGERLAGRSLPRALAQLLVYHFMFGPDYTAGCPSCSAIADGFDGFVVHLANPTSRFRRCRGRRLQGCRRTSDGWGGPFPGRPRWAATSTSTSMSGSPRSNSAREVSNTTTVARRRYVSRSQGRPFKRGSRAGDQGPVAEMCGDDRNRRGHVHARKAGHERVRARGRRRSTPTPPMRAGWTASGHVPVGSTAPPKGRTRRRSWWRRHDEYGKG